MTTRFPGFTLASVEEVKAALDVKFTARSDGQIKRVLESASNSAEAFLHRQFAPFTGTKYFDWPRSDYARSWRLWLNGDDIVSATTVVAGGTTVASTDYFLEPVNDGPPYTHIEIDLASSAAWSAGDTHQRSIAITGVWGFRNDEEAAGTLAEALDASETGVDVSDSSLIGVGNIIRVDSERMIVTGKAMLDTGQNTSVLTAASSDVSITGVTAGTVAVDETVLVDSERMLVVDVAGTTLTVKRAYDGTVLAAHSAGADIYAPRTLTVTRGALGTTAATHSTSATVYRHAVPGLAVELGVAEALNTMLQRQSGYAREVGSGDNARESSGRGLKQIREDAYTALARKARKAAV